MSYWMRTWAAAAGTMMALAAPVAVVTIALPAVSGADVCVNGQVLNNVGVCVDVLAPPPQQPAPPPPEGVACVTATGRHGYVSAGACV
jgi:hypothetical protein